MLKKSVKNKCVKMQYLGEAVVIVDVLGQRVENCAPWFLRQPHCEAKSWGIYIVFFNYSHVCRDINKVPSYFVGLTNNFCYKFSEI